MPKSTLSLSDGKACEDSFANVGAVMIPGLPYSDSGITL
jgi:hypothetical protein